MRGTRARQLSAVALGALWFTAPSAVLAARGASPSSHREPPVTITRPAWARRDDREYREYLREEQRSQAGCSAGRMQPDLHHGLLAPNGPPFVRPSHSY